MNGRTSESIPFESRDEDNRRLREENARLRRLLAAHGIPVPTPHEDVPALQTSLAVQAESKEERARKRIALCRNLSREREDIYPRRWENQDGRFWISP